MSELYGYSEKELVGKSFREYMDEDSTVYVQQVFNNVFKTGRPSRVLNYTAIMKDGSKKYIEISVALILDKKGNKVGFRGIGRDVSENKKTEDVLRRRNEAMERDLQTAQRIQRSLVSITMPDLDWIRADYRYLPLDAVGGDYFSFTTFREGGLGVFIGDVANHGVTAALHLSLVKATSERICRNYSHMPGQYIKRLNMELLGNMPLSFLTAAYGVFGKHRNGKTTFTFSSGGHPYPILCCADGADAEYVECRGTLIGVFDDLKFQERTISLEKGDRLFLYTDGVYETFNEKKEMIGFDWLPVMIKNCNGTTLESTLDNIIGEINAFRGNVDLSDDIVLLGFEVTGD
jgi:PAS domain S-box-containing protein